MVIYFEVIGGFPMEEKPKTEPMVPIEPIDPDAHPEWEPRRLCPDQKIDHTVPDEPTE